MTIFYGYTHYSLLIPDNDTDVLSLGVSSIVVLTVSVMAILSTYYNKRSYKTKPIMSLLLVK